MSHSEEASVVAYASNWGSLHISREGQSNLPSVWDLWTDIRLVWEGENTELFTGCSPLLIDIQRASPTSCRGMRDAPQTSIFFIHSPLFNSLSASNCAVKWFVFQVPCMRTSSTGLWQGDCLWRTQAICANGPTIPIWLVYQEQNGYSTSTCSRYCYRVTSHYTDGYLSTSTASGTPTSM